MRKLGGGIVLWLIFVLSTPLFAPFPAWTSQRELDEVRAAIVAKGARWVAEETSVSKMDPAERRKLLGAQKPVLTGSEARSPRGLSGPVATVVPTAFDWRNTGGKNFVTPVRNQARCGSCWAFATTAALEAYVLITQNTPGTDVNLSEQVLVSCSGAGDCELGGGIGGASEYIMTKGLPLESCFPYKAVSATNGAPCSNACSTYQTNTYKTYDWYYVATYSPTVSAIKDALYTYGPLVTTMDVYTDFFNYSSGVYSYVSGVYEGGHAILIVGYDDAGGYFIVKNSWGSWGESGYFKIAYSQLANKVEFGWYTIAYQAPPQASYTVNTNPPGLQVTVDGSVYTSPHTFTWSSGTVHTIGSSSPQLAPDGRTRYVFSSWNDAGLQTHQVTAPAVSTTYVASFVTQYSLTSTVNPSAGGSVTLTPNAPWYDSGQAVQARIIPSAGYTFSGWSGDLSGTANPASVTMNGPKAVTANLTQNQYTLAAIGNPSCSGSVIKAPDKGTYVYGDNVQLRATANPGYAFSAWGADGSGSANPVTIVINGNKSVTANFNTATPPPSGQGQWRVRFLTETGDTVTTTTRPMGQYFIHGEDATLTMILHGPLSFVPTCPDLGISPVSGGNCTLAGDGSVTARAGQAFSFSVSSLTPGTTLSASDLPINASGLQATFNPGTGIFQWSTSPNDVGTYSVVFQAAVTTPSTVVSQFVVPMNITP